MAGAIWENTHEHEKILDEYEGFPNIYQKDYFYWQKKKVMFYIMNKYFFKNPPTSYIQIINEGYKNCNINISIKI